MRSPLVRAATRLVARTVALDPSVAESLDLLAVAGDDGRLWEHEGTGLAGRGVALVVDVDPGAGRLHRAAGEVTARLDEIEAHDEVGRPGCGPVAIGALPFDDDVPGQLVVPAHVLGRAADGTAWVTTVGPEDEAAGDTAASSLVPTVPRAGARPVAPGPARDVTEVGPPPAWRVIMGRPAEEWRAAVTAGLDEIGAGYLEKVVLAREVTVTVGTGAPLSPVAVLARLRAAYPSCFLFSVDGLVGASPELLVARWGDRVQSQPLAGSAPRGDGPEADRRLADGLLASAKERAEHEHVVAAVVDALGPVCETLHAAPAPSVVAMATVQHLGTAVHGRLRAPAPGALALAARLHPTPAVGGTPRDAALDAIRRLEGFARGRYAGPVGWVDARGDGQWAVAIRTAELDGHRARLVAGAGIVAGSRPDAELAETELKLQALLSAVVGGPQPPGV